MTDDQKSLSRREFAALVAAGVASAAGAGALPAGGLVADVIDTDVRVTTPSGECDAALEHPLGNARWPAVILFPDIFGVRPTMRAMAKRLALRGFTVLIPNPYYRSTKAPGIAADFDFGSTADRARLAALRAPLTQAGVMQDAAAYVDFLDRHPRVDARPKMGVMGYCMGGPMTLQAAASRPDRIGAGASFHGGGLVTDASDSPHLLVPKIRAEYYFGIAANDDEKQPDAKTRLDQAFRDAHARAKIEVYEKTLHGWCVPDMPAHDTTPVYDEPQAERAWQELLALYRRTLV